jgi:hypothetical protein
VESQVELAEGVQDGGKSIAGQAAHVRGHVPHDPVAEI